MNQTITYRGGITIDHGLCTGCKKCYEACPTDTFDFDEETKLVVQAYPEECWFCGACIYECNVDGAMKMELPLACL